MFKNKHLILFSILAIFFITVMLFLTLVTIMDNVVLQEIGEMRAKLIEKQITIETLNARATEDIIFALKNSAFVEYFELPETRAGNIYDQHGVMQFTEDQRKIKTELEQWIWNFQNKFDVDETCIIDTTGQEHARLVLKRIETDQFLSPDEKETPFFEPSFKKEIDEVHIQYPYVSPDTDRWVFAYTSPVVLGKEKPAIYHFEMPITVFQDMITIDHGRMYVLDPQGFVMADSNNNEFDFSYSFEEHFPASDTILPDKLLSEMQKTNQGVASYETSDDIFHLVYSTIPPFGWILVIEESHSIMLSENNTLTNTMIILVTLGIMIGSVVIFLLLTNRITSGMLELGKMEYD